MKYIGAHVSASGGVENAPLNAAKIGANAFALFVKNQRQWEAKPLTAENIEKFKTNLKAVDIEPRHVLPHNSYLINLGHFDKAQREKSVTAFLDEITRVEALGLETINFHPGSHLREIGEEECLENISQSVNFLLRNSSGVKLVIENTAGQGSNVGYKLEHLAYIINRCDDDERIGVCIDTCHAFAAGYDLTKLEFYNEKDRHESLGKGFLGLESFKCIMQDSRTDDIPLILETIDESIWADEIKLLKNLRGDTK